MPNTDGSLAWVHSTSTCRFFISLVQYAGLEQNCLQAGPRPKPKAPKQKGPPSIIKWPNFFFFFIIIVLKK